MTNQAAHKVLELVEKQAAQLSAQQTEIEAERAKRDSIVAPMHAQDFVEFSSRLLCGLGSVANTNSEILMAQEFQDLSGQILKKVIHVITEVEESLVTLIRVFGLAEGGDVQPEAPVESQKVEQGDVDSLLASLGF